MSRTFYLNGNFVPEEEAKVSVTSHALHYGTGCFEGIRAYYSEKENALFIFRLKDHFVRFFQSANLLFINIPQTIDELCKITEELIQKNFDKTDLYIRPIAFKSDPAVGNFNLKTLQDSLAIYTVAMGRYLNTDQGIKVGISSWTRVNDNSIPPRAKITGSYANSSLAKTEGLLSGYDEVLLLDNQGHITEGSTENIFLIKNNKVLTSAISNDILVGITRDTVIRLLKDELGLEVIERSIDRSEVYQADEAFFVGTGAEVTPIVEVDHRSIGGGQIGETTRKVKELYYQVVHGENSKYLEFLTRVSNF